MHEPPLALVAYEDEHVRHLIQLELEEAGFAVRQASTAQSALDVLRADSPDVFLLDRYLAGQPPNQVIDHITAGSEIGRMAITCDRLDEQDVRTRFPNVPVIVKPWEYGELASICLSLLGPTIEATPA